MLNINIPLEEMKNYLRMNGFDGFPTQEDDLLQDLISSAIEDVSTYINRDYKDVDIPTSFKVAAMKIVAIRYEDRIGDTKQLVDNTLKQIAQYRRLPGL